MARSGLPELEGLNGASSRIKALSTVPKVSLLADVDSPSSRLGVEATSAIACRLFRSKVTKARGVQKTQLAGCQHCGI